jgi:predicted ATPase
MTTATHWYASPEYRAFLRDYGYDGGLYPFAYRTLSLWILGRPDQARIACEELMALAMASANPYGLAIAQSFDVLLAILCGETAAALEGASRLSAHVNEQKLYFFLCPAMCAQGWAAVHEERPDDGIALIQQGLGFFQMIGVRAFYPYYLSFLAEAHLARRAVDEGLATVDEALTLCRTTVDCFYEAELLRLQAELLRLGNRRDEAKASFEAALELARRQGALSFELRAATGLARLLHDGGQDAAAQPLLRGVYERFTEGFDSRDLALARSLLVEQRAS